MNQHRKELSKRLVTLGVEERAWPGRDDGFASLHYQGRDLGHFHPNGEIDLRLGKDIRRRERLEHPADSTVHPGRSPNSPWHEMKVESAADVDEAARLVQLAIAALKVRK